MGIVRVGILLLAVLLAMPIAVAQAQPGMVEAIDAPVVTELPRRFGVGYVRGAGLGNYGVSAAMTAGKRLVPQVLVFGFHSDGQTGFAVAPAIQLSFVDNRQHSPFIAAGLQLALHRACAAGQRSCNEEKERRERRNASGSGAPSRVRRGRVRVLARRQREQERPREQREQR